MQMYKGLPIITNKMTVEERRGVPHHFLGTVNLDEDTWNAPKFKTEAARVIQDIRSRGRLPIVVGGSHYYADSLLFDDRTVYVAGAEESRKKHPILKAPPEAVLEKLREVDPVMAGRWHPNDTRKILRSLEIYYETGRRASDIYAEQQQQSGNGGWSTLLFWVYSEPKVLELRLQERIQKMVDRGLLGEVGAQLALAKDREAKGQEVDRGRGIWQSIGLAQLEPYFTSGSPSPKLLDECLEAMNFATRQCVRAQLRWIRLKTIPALRKHRMVDSLYVFDSSDLSKWQDDVSKPALQVTKKYLANQAPPSPVSVSETARRVLEDNTRKKGVPCRHHCQVCNRIFTIQHEWETHLTSKPHRNVVKRARKRALVPLDDNRSRCLAVISPSDSFQV